MIIHEMLAKTGAIVRYKLPIMLGFPIQYVQFVIIVDS